MCKILYVITDSPNMNSIEATLVQSGEYGSVFDSKKEAIKYLTNGSTLFGCQPYLCQISISLSNIETPNYSKIKDNKNV